MRSRSLGLSPNARPYLRTVALQNAGYGAIGAAFAIHVKASGFTEAVVGDVEAAGLMGVPSLPPESRTARDGKRNDAAFVSGIKDFRSRGRVGRMLVP